MKLSVSVRGEWFAIPCEDGSSTIEWLGTEAARRYRKLPKFRSSAGRRGSAGSGNETKMNGEMNGKMNGGTHDEVLAVRKTHGGALLDPEDSISSILDDNDFVTVALKHEEDEISTMSMVPEDIQWGNGELTEYIALDGFTLTTKEVMKLGNGKMRIKLAVEAEKRVVKARNLIEKIVAENKVVYGITTGFGKFAKVIIPTEKLVELQENLIRSHAAGVGPPLSADKVRRFAALRINVLAKGFSGISLTVLNQFIAAFNANCLPWIPEKGTVGASGDLAPLSHMALGLMGEGKMWSPETGWEEADKVLSSHGLTPLKLGPKEGIALINGTQFITSIGVEALERSYSIFNQGNAIAALTLEVLKGTTKAFDGDVHRARPHKGQIQVARTLRSLLHSDTHPSEIAESHRFCDRVQDAYTLRCCPQVHGIVIDTIDFVKGILSVEINSGTDNPMVFADRGETISAGNFHGEYPAKALDYLAIGIHELANMSERRLERLVNPAYSELPAFLTNDGGINSGFMIAHCTAAALVSENKVLTHPSSVDSLTTSAGTEDHVSMGGFSARKALTVVENVEHVLAIELLAACQAIEFLRPLKTTAPLEAVYDLVRSVAKKWDKDRFMAPDIEAVTKLLKEEKIWKAVKPFMDRYHEVQVMETPVNSPSGYTDMSGPSPSKRRKHASGC